MDAVGLNEIDQAATMGIALWAEMRNDQKVDQGFDQIWPFIFGVIFFRSKLDQTLARFAGEFAEVWAIPSNKHAGQTARDAQLAKLGHQGFADAYAQRAWKV